MVTSNGFGGTAGILFFRWMQYDDPKLWYVRTKVIAVVIDDYCRHFNSLKPKIS